MQTFDIPAIGETKTLPSGIVVKNISDSSVLFRWAYYKHGICYTHNENGPAYIYKDNAINVINYHIVYRQHDKLHRLDGPAIILFYNTKEFFIEDIEFSEEEYWRHPDVLAFKYLKEHPELEAFV